MLISRQIENGIWRRKISLDGASGTVEVGMADARQGALRATIRFPAVASLPAIVRRIRRVFDLSADPIVIGKQLADDPLLAPLVRKRPGLRVPGHWEDAAESRDDSRLRCVRPGKQPAADGDGAPGRTRDDLARELRSLAERWRPWRAYAVAHLLLRPGRWRAQGLRPARANRRCRQGGSPVPADASPRACLTLDRVRTPIGALLIVSDATAVCARRNFTISKTACIVRCG